MWHHFGHVDDGRINRDLVHVYRSLFSGKHLDARNLSLLIESYVARTDLKLEREARPEDSVRCPTLIMCGHDSPHVDETVELNGRLRPGVGTWMKLQDCSMVLEEQPGKVAEALRLFIQGLGYSLSSSSNHRRRAAAGDQRCSSRQSADQCTDQSDVHIVENPIAETS